VPKSYNTDLGPASRCALVRGSEAGEPCQSSLHLDKNRPAPPWLSRCRPKRLTSLPSSCARKQVGTSCCWRRNPGGSRCSEEIADAQRNAAPPGNGAIPAGRGHKIVIATVNCHVTIRPGPLAARQFDSAEQRSDSHLTHIYVTVCVTVLSDSRSLGGQSMGAAVGLRGGCAHVASTICGQASDNRELLCGNYLAL
jgi:hypothetical protein